MGAVATIPKSAPFSEEDVELLNRVVGPATAVQRAWLAGFLAAVEQGAGAPRTSIAPDAEPLTIVYASESGNSEKLAADLARQSRNLGFKPTLIDMAELDLATLTAASRLVVVAATWGEGEPPGRASRVYAELMQDAAPRLDGVEYGVLALGDTAYAEFCAIGKRIDERLAELGAKRMVERVDCDLDFAEPAGKWIAAALQRLAPPQAARSRVIEVDFAANAAAKTNPGIVEAEIIEHLNLNSSRSDKETIHLALAFGGAAPGYEPGDSLELYPENDPAYVDEVLALTNLTEDEALRGDLIAGRDVTTLSVKTLESYAALTGDARVKALISERQAREWVAGRQLVDLLASFPAALAAEQLRALTRPLSPRAYSVASSRREFADEAHLLVSPVRYNSNGRARKGVASNYVARLKRGDRVRVKLRTNRHFALPDPGRDIIMVGPGTGVASFRAFVQERRATGAKGRNWLFFGDRRFTHDFLYQLEWQDALKDGSLTRMDVAFSRDRPEKTYVQHKMWDRRRDLIDWLDSGAHFYVCGDAKAMAKDVRSTLTRAYAEVKALGPEAADAAIAGLERAKRYLQDVY
ncbi:MAG TPA: flavodoxin domain-containing protein [Xanthobacteraceae bacterium]|nr:flavodoxin domain-containing protein [Xanthobacteraceae bacterium]